jgi:hypothetical protein
MGGMWRITLSPPASATGNMTMMVTDYQGPLISAFLALQDVDEAEADAPDCSGPIRGVLRWEAEPRCTAVNAFAGLFVDEAAFQEMPAVLTQRLDAEQRQVLSGISGSGKAVHVVDALAGTGKSHLARCLINRWGEVADNSLGFLVVALRTRTLRQEFLQSVLADQVGH